MPDLIITAHEDGLTIDGALPEGYRLIVHNHTGRSDFYSYTERKRDCRYPSTPDRVEDEEEGGGVRCYLYAEDGQGDA